MGLHKCLLESIIMYNEKFVPFAEIIFRPPLLPLGMIFLLLSYHKGSEQILIVPWRGTILLVSILLVPWKSCKCAILMLFPAGDKLENTRPALQWACARDPQNHHSRGPLALCSPSLPPPPQRKQSLGRWAPALHPPTWQRVLVGSAWEASPTLALNSKDPQQWGGSPRPVNCWAAMGAGSAQHLHVHPTACTQGPCMWGRCSCRSHFGDAVRAASHLKTKWKVFHLCKSQGEPGGSLRP